MAATDLNRNASTGSTDSSSEAFSPEEVAQFERDGYFVARRLASEALCARMLEVTRDGLQREVPPVEYEADLNYPGAPPSLDAAGGHTVRRLKQALSRDFCFVEWASAPPLVNRLRQLLGPAVVMPLAHHNCIMTKEPRHSSDTGWHQDIRYWSFERPELVSVWLALTPETTRNGCLRLIPGSNRLSLDRGRFDQDLFLRPELPENQALIAQAVWAELEPGDVLFFHARTFHAASRNHTDRPKFSVVFTFRGAENPPKPGSRSSSLPELVLPGPR
ncbi:MAG TPA: phytanoyl-CoA dioxygenase family protein [Planctomycetaceae bacterium]|jgi:phytanoyl-CoA hydroxylase|nr:phytanoyl-CoA dioxygenase family protein [Planctomycetaceae bacterium]